MFLHLSVRKKVQQTRLAHAGGANHIKGFRAPDVPKKFGEDVLSEIDWILWAELTHDSSYFTKMDFYFSQSQASAHHDS
jgi:hypothetical protein